MLFRPPSPLYSSLLLTGAGPGNGASFVGALDAYAATLEQLCCMTLKLLSSYDGPAFRMRVDTGGSPEYDINFLPDGTFDAAAVTSNAAGNNWFVRKVYDQSGNGRDFDVSTASAQPQGAVDGNGLAYCYAPGAGFSTTNLITATGLALAVTDTTEWSVASADAYMLDLGGMRTAGVTERRHFNYSTAIQALAETAGSSATISSTNTGLYTVTCQVRASGTRLANRLTFAAGTKTSAAFTADRLQFGNGGGGPNWAQNSKFYARALWSSDIGNTAADAINTLAQPLFDTQ